MALQFHYTFAAHLSHNCRGLRSFIIKRMCAWVCWHSAQMSCIFRSRSFNGHRSRLASSPWQRREKCCSSHSYYFHSLKCPSHAARATGQRGSLAFLFLAGLQENKCVRSSSRLYVCFLPSLSLMNYGIEMLQQNTTSTRSGRKCLMAMRERAERAARRRNKNDHFSLDCPLLLLLECPIDFLAGHLFH